jgi:excisionase family DNA binding protein
LPSSEATVSAAEAAAIWGCSPEAIRKAVRAGRLPGRCVGGRWLIPEAAVREAAVRRRRYARAGAGGRHSGGGA